MTVIAWDGKIIAADKQGTYGDLKRTSTKLFELDTDEVIAFCGTIGTSHRMLEWYKAGADPRDWPEDLQNSDDWSQIIIADCDGARYYDRQPYAQKVHDPFMAWGRGCEAAIGALAMGASAQRAVEIASQYIEGCGRGVDWFEVKS